MSHVAMPSRVPSRALYDDPIDSLKNLQKAEKGEIDLLAARASQAFTDLAIIYSIRPRDVAKIGNATRAWVEDRISKDAYEQFLRAVILATNQKAPWPLYSVELNEMLLAGDVGGLVDVIQTRDRQNPSRQTAEKLAHHLLCGRLESGHFEMEPDVFFYFFNNLGIGTQAQRNDVLKSYLSKHPDIAQAPEPRFLKYFWEKEETQVWRKNTLADILSLSAMGQFPHILDAFKTSEKDFLGSTIPTFQDGRTMAQVIDEYHPPSANLPE